MVNGIYCRKLDISTIIRMENNMVSIAIDGPSGAGKSTIAKRVAKLFGFVYVDTGAIYRTIGLEAFNRGVSTKDKEKVLQILPEINIDLCYNDAGEQRMFLNGEDVSEKIRLPEISMCASDVSAFPEVREYLMDMQRNMALKYDVIMDGRDIGTVILPNADLKVFLTASAEERAKRRYKELIRRGNDVSFEYVLEDMKKRDEQDMNRAAAPLVPANDSVYLDTSELDIPMTVNALKNLVIEKTGRMPVGE